MGECVYVCVRICVRACVRACVCACVRVCVLAPVVEVTHTKFRDDMILAWRVRGMKAAMTPL